jgi:hypothetical protein
MLSVNANGQALAYLYGRETEADARQAKAVAGAAWEGGSRLILPMWGIRHAHGPHNCGSAPWGLGHRRFCS